jgi:hypothetical protein
VAFSSAILKECRSAAKIHPLMKFNFAFDGENQEILIAQKTFQKRALLFVVSQLFDWVPKGQLNTHVVRP